MYGLFMDAAAKDAFALYDSCRRLGRAACISIFGNGGRGASRLRCRVPMTLSEKEDEAVVPYGPETSVK